MARVTVAFVERAYVMLARPYLMEATLEAYTLSDKRASDTWGIHSLLRERDSLLCHVPQATRRLRQRVSQHRHGLGKVVDKLWLGLQHVAHHLLRYDKVDTAEDGTDVQQFGHIC